MGKPNATNEYVMYNGNGQAVAANSAPVVVASDQSAIPVTVSALNANTAALITAVAATTEQTSATQTNTIYRGCIVVLDVTAIDATGSLTLTIEAQDAASGKWYPLVTSSAVVAISTTKYQVYPASAAASQNYNGALPVTWRVRVTPANGVAITYKVGAALQG